MPRSPMFLCDIEGVRRLAPAEYEHRRFIKIFCDWERCDVCFDETIDQFEHLGFKVRHKVFKRLWRGGWFGGYHNPKFRDNPTRPYRHH